MLSPAILSIFYTKYSKIILIIQITANKNDPKAILPKLYLKTHHIDLLISISPLASLVEVKYQVHTQHDIMKKLQANISAMTHNKAKNIK
jgi:hypothetical protein